MDTDTMLAAFDRLRRNPEPGPLGDVVEHAGPVVRVVRARAGWTGVTWSDLGGSDVDAVIAEQVARFAGLGRPWEWKHYSYDRPTDLPDRLVAAGFTAGPPEALLVAEIGDLGLDSPAPPGVELVPVTDTERVRAMVAVHDDVFGGDNANAGEAVLAAQAHDPSTGAGVVAMAGRVPVAAGRVDFHAGTEFASLWGGATVPAWRGRGVFRSLVAHRAALAAGRGFRYLLVDASSASEPILRRLGFVGLATTTPYTYEGGT